MTGRSERTYDPICSLQQPFRILLPPDRHTRVHLHPGCNLLQSFLNALHFRRADIGVSSGRMSVERGERDVVEVNQPDIRDSPENSRDTLTKQAN
jgi:hypothetical protein